jgi:hypothetical protein
MKLFDVLLRSLHLACRGGSAAAPFDFVKRRLVLVASLATSVFMTSSNGADRADHRLLDELPKRLHAAARKNVEDPHRIEDGPVTAKTVERQRKYNETLVTMMHEIVKAFPALGTAKSVDKYVKDTYGVHKFRSSLVEKSERGESVHEVNGILLRAAADFETVIEEMVVRVTRDDPSFDYQSWKRHWEAAKDPYS